MSRMHTAFARCATCTHAGFVRAPVCRLCGGAVAATQAPPDVFNGWRCGCFHFTGTPC